MAKKKRASTTDHKLTKPDKARPRSQALPGMEDRAIAALEAVAEDYADIRDRRMALTIEETDLKQRALTLMHKHNKTVYRRDGVEIRIIAGDEKLAVRILKHDPDQDDDDDKTSAEHVEMSTPSGDG